MFTINIALILNRVILSSGRPQCSLFYKEQETFTYLRYLCTSVPSTVQRAGEKIVFPTTAVMAPFPWHKTLDTLSKAIMFSCLSLETVVFQIVIYP